MSRAVEDTERLPWQIHHNLLGVQAKFPFRIFISNITLARTPQLPWDPTKIHKTNKPGAVARSDQRPYLVCRQSRVQSSHHFHLFRIWSSAWPRPMINVILQFLLLDLLSINFYAFFFQNNPTPIMSFGLFSLFQTLQMVIASTNDNSHLAISSARSCQYQPSASVDVFMVVQSPFQFYCYRFF